MAKGASFHRGSSGSPKHTEVMGSQGYDAGHTGESGPRIGPGVEKNRVRPEYDRNGSASSSPKAKNVRRYSEG